MCVCAAVQNNINSECLVQFAPYVLQACNANVKRNQLNRTKDMIDYSYSNTNTKTK